MTARSRRGFLAAGVRAALGLSLAGVSGVNARGLGVGGRANGEPEASARTAAGAGTPGDPRDLAGPEPEYAAALDELLCVYDQVRASHLLREIVEIVRHASDATRLHVLVSPALRDEAEARFSAHGVGNLRIVPIEAESLSGSWGRDILQVTRSGRGRRIAHVPWHKQATTREELRESEVRLAPLAHDDLDVRLLPAAFEGGNLMADRTSEGRRVLFAGSTIAVETRALYQRWYDSTIGSADVARVLADGLGVDEVVWIGPRDRSGHLARQPRLLFHVDMGMTLVAPGTAVVARMDPEAPWPSAHRELIAAELARTREALERRRRLGVPIDSLAAVPAAAATDSVVAARELEERRALADAAAHLEDTATRLSDRGYRVHRLDTEPERARRFQSYVNVIPSRDRLIVPIYPSIDRVHGWVVPGRGGRDRVDLELGLRDSAFALEGGNLAALELFRTLHPDVRLVRDYFFLASGNVHCVIGRVG